MSQYGEHPLVRGFVADTNFVGANNESGLQKQRKKERRGQTQPDTDSTHPILPTHTHTHAQTHTSINAPLRLIFSRYPRIIKAWHSSNLTQVAIKKAWTFSRTYMHHHEWQIHDADVLLFTQSYEWQNTVSQRFASSLGVWTPSILLISLRHHYRLPKKSTWTHHFPVSHRKFSWARQENCVSVLPIWIRNFLVSTDTQFSCSHIMMKLQHPGSHTPTMRTDLWGKSVYQSFCSTKNRHPFEQVAGAVKLRDARVCSPV